MSIEFLQFFWYCIIYVALTAFAVLDGFDLGVGILHLTTKKDVDRRIFLNAIGPVWDGNAVWLIIVTGGLFAGFPLAFGTIFSSFYDLMIILLGGIIFRTVAIEFRSKRESAFWRNTWDVLFCLASLIMTVSVGLLLANLIVGIPFDQDGMFHGNFKTFFNFYTVLFAISVVSLFAMHGLIYLLMKTEGSLRHHLKKMSMPIVFFFILCFASLTLSTWFLMPHMVARFMKYPWLISLGALGAILSVAVLIDVFFNKMGRAFISSSLIITILFFLCGIGNYPVLLRSTLDAGFNLTIENARSSHLTLTVLFYIVLIGVPFVLAYSYWLYKIFRGKVVIDSHSY